MTRTAYLRIYQPLGAFPEKEREAWLRPEQERPSDGPPKGWLLAGVLPTAETLPTEGAFVRKTDLGVLVCPWRTRLRMLVGLLAFRGSVPEEVAEAFVPEDKARTAAFELERLEQEHPEVRSHIVHSNWHVPLRWFAAFSGEERILTEDKDGLRIRYETPISVARQRLSKALEVLEGSWIDDSVVAALRDLAGWIGEFTEEGLIELDYGSVAAIFTDEDLLEDHSARDVWVCLDALESGDLVKAGRLFAELTERWTDVRASEVIN